MGLTPLEGLVMGTRSGDVDPAVLFHLHRELGWSVDEIDGLLNKRVRPAGAVRRQRHARDRPRGARSGDPAARLAFDVYCHRLRKYVGAYYAVLGTGRRDRVHRRRRGELRLRARARRCPAWSGSASRSTRTATPRGSGPRLVSPDGSDVAVLVVPTDEEREIARQAVEVVSAAGE